MQTKRFNKREKIIKRKYLRTNGTSAEAVLWLSLKNKQLDGRRFRRQFSIGDFIIDFYCPKEKLGIELDGADHFTEFGIKYDEQRTDRLNKMGIKILRFENDLIFKRHESVLSSIKEHFSQ